MSSSHSSSGYRAFIICNLLCILRSLVWRERRRAEERPRRSPGEPRRAQGSPGEPRRAQESPGVPRGAQESPAEPRRAQESPAEPRRAQVSRGEPRRPQESQGEESAGEYLRNTECVVFRRNMCVFEIIRIVEIKKVLLSRGKCVYLK